MGKWTHDEESILKKHYGNMLNSELRAVHLPTRSVKSISGKALEMGLKSPQTRRKHTPHPKMGQNLPVTEDLTELWDAIYNFQAASQGRSSRVDEAPVEVKTTEPIMVGFLADAHIGAITCKYRDIVDRFEAMVGAPNFYLVSVGDSIDNYLPTHHGDGTFAQLVPPELQKQLVEDLYSRMKGRWLGVVQGCHDEWSHEVDDFDWNKHLARHLGCPNLGFGGTINLTVGDTLYKISLRHKYNFNSSLNLTNSVKRMRDFLGDFDIGCIAHHHQAAVEQMVMGDGVDRIFIRPGSFKGADRYARQSGYRDTGAYIPTVALYPDRRRMIPFLHLEQGIEWMRGTL